MVKITVSIPAVLLERLDQAARQAHTSRSAFLAEAVESYLKEREEEKLREQRRRAAASMREIAKLIGPWDGTEESTERVA